MMYNADVAGNNHHGIVQRAVFANVSVRCSSYFCSLTRAYTIVMASNFMEIIASLTNFILPAFRSEVQ